MKIAITGPESTGKSNLASQLSQHFSTVFVPEYAREYIDNLWRPYNEDDLLQIAKGQLHLEEKMLPRANKLLFCDTEMTVMKIWSLHKYGRCHPHILQKLHEQSYGLVLLCNVDLQWEADHQREHPKHRKFFFDWYITELNLQGANYAIVSGLGNDRLNNALSEVQKYLDLPI